MKYKSNEEIICLSCVSYLTKFFSLIRTDCASTFRFFFELQFSKTFGYFVGRPKQEKVSRKNGYRNGNWVMLLYSNWMRLWLKIKLKNSFDTTKRIYISNIGVYWLNGNLCRLLNQEAVCYVCMKHECATQYHPIAGPRTIRIYIDFNDECTTGPYRTQPSIEILRCRSCGNKAFGSRVRFVCMNAQRT